MLGLGYGASQASLTPTHSLSGDRGEGSVGLLMLRGVRTAELGDRGVMGTDARVAGVWQALGALGEGLTQAFGSPVAGDPEDQLKSHVRPFIEQCGTALGFPIVAKTESR